MRKYFSILIICSLPLLLSSQETGSISGQVLDASDNSPRQGANIYIDSTRMSAKADSNGNYVIKNVQAGTYNINVDFPFYTPSRDNEVSVIAGKNTVVNFILLREHTLISVDDTLSIKAENAYYDKDYDLAEIYLKMYISRNIPIQDSLNLNAPGYMNKKNIACEYLQNIYLEREYYEKALFFHRLMNGTYKWRCRPLEGDFGICGPSEYDRDFFYVQCFSGLHQYDSALKYLNKYSFYVGFVSEENTADWIIYLSNNLFGKDYVKKNLLNAIDNIYLLYGTFYTVFLGERHWININNNSIYRNFYGNITTWEETKRLIQQEIRNSILYKLIMEE